MVFGDLADKTKGGWGYVFAFNALPMIIYFSAVMSILYYLGVMQVVIWAIARAMTGLMRTSGAETLTVASNIFVGQTEAPLVAKPYVPTMTRSEIMAMMTGGFGSAERKDGAVDNVMPEFRQLPDEDLAAILTYIREKFGGGASPVTASDIAAARNDL